MLWSTMSVLPITVWLDGSMIFQYLHIYNNDDLPNSI